MVVQTFVFFKNPVVFATGCRFEPAASRMPFTFWMVRSVCCRMSVPAISPVFGSSATCPETYKNPFDRMACEYGPIGFGPRSLRTVSFIIYSPLKDWAQLRQRYPTASEHQPGHP